MINNTFRLLVIIFLLLISFSLRASEKFNFDVTEVEILENGNKFKGIKRGTITSENDIIIDADQFEYDKKLNILNAQGNVKVNDTLNNYLIFSDKIIYDKNKEIIFTKNKSKGINLNDNTEITAKNFEYNKLKNILIAEKNVKLKNKVKNYTINSEFATYLINKEKVFTKGETSALIKSKYKIDSKDMTFLKIPMKLMSDHNTTVTDKVNLYNFKKFIYFINSEEVRGHNVIVKSNFKSPESDQFYFSSANINLNTQNFVAKDTKIKIHKNVFDDPENDPRLYGAIRNHKPDLMYKLFSIAGYNKAEVDEKFSGMINALSYGAPPHGGIAPGIDRIVMLLADEKNIREVTMFPMNQNAQDLMMNAPSEVNKDQLKELNLSIKTKN
ncbi:hypothetical protein OA868_01130 [Candidatus Pelagibacter sp.]|nr:hypothetical protein [Candidatus Pelagibacter sp.]